MNEVVAKQDTMLAIMHEAAMWADSTFTQSTVHSIATHLVREAIVRNDTGLVPTPADWTRLRMAGDAIVEELTHGH
jgi:hypothetical protein